MGRVAVVLVVALAALAAACGAAERQPGEPALPGLGDGCSRYDLLPVSGPSQRDARDAAGEAILPDENLPAPTLSEPTRVDADHVVVHVTQDVLDWFVQLRSDGAGRWRATWVAQCWQPPSGNAPDPTSP